MGKRGRVLIAATAITVLTVLAWTLLHAPAPEPVYNGKPLSYWLQGFGNVSKNTTLPNDGEATAAIRQIGTNAIPTLLRMLRAHDSPFKSRFLKWAYHYRFVRLRYQSAGNLNMEALRGFSELGPAATDAIPDLIKTLDL